MNTIKDRIFALLDTVLKGGNFNQAFHPVIINLARSFLTNVSDGDLREGIIQLRDKMIPWILDGDPPDENKNIE